MLAMALEELPDAPLYYNLHDVAKSVKLSAPPVDTFRSALVNAGALTLPLGFAQPSGMQAPPAPQRARRFIFEWAARDGSACSACHAVTALPICMCGETSSWRCLTEHLTAAWPLV